MMSFDSIWDAEDKVMILKNMFAGIRIVNPESKKVTCIISQALPEGTNGLCYKFWATDEVCVNCISMRALNERRTVVKIGGKRNDIYAVSALPVVIGGERLVMEFIQDITDNLCFEDEESCDDPKMLMQSISSYIDKLLIRDSLTGLYNRRFIDESLPVALVCARASDQPLSVIYADIDYFKSINDNYGHVVGDQILQGVADLFHKNIRSGDSWTARYGGEEFLICLPGMDYKAAKKIAERLRNAIMQKEFHVLGKTLHVTCSFGVQTVYGKNCEITALDIIALADKNMYIAKASGRNKVV